MNAVATAPATDAAPATATACAAVVVHYRDAASTLRCVASLRRQRPAPWIVVVDNDSPDGSGADVAAALRGADDVEVLRSPRNGGFGAGCNLGLAAALRRLPTLEHALLLNPDAELDDGALAAMRATQRRRDADVVGCRIVDAAGAPWFENGRIPRWTLSGFHAPADAREEHPAGFVSGACMLLAGSMLRAGLRFDERYFLYCEDADLCEQVRARGGSVWLTRAARAVHVGGGSQPGEAVLGELTAARLYWLTRAKALFARRWLGPLQRACFLAVATVAKPLAGLALARSPRFLAPYWRGLRDGLTAKRPR